MWKKALKFSLLASLDFVAGARLQNKVVQHGTEVLWIPTAEIRQRIIGYTLRSLHFRGKSERVIGGVLDGFWDRSVDSVESGIAHRGLIERFVEGKSWEETSYFKAVQRKFASGKRHRLDTSAAGFLERKMAAWDRLFESMRDDGYKTHAELLAAEAQGDWVPVMIPKEIEIAIGRDGAMILCDGKHRFAMATILKLEMIPVVVNVWHRHYVDRFIAECGEPVTAENLMAFRAMGRRPGPVHKGQPGS